jgi:zinc D-Ala-D-Ala dipeptidase
MRQFFVLTFLLSTHVFASLPTGFVYLKDIEPSIIEDIRFAGIHNITGKPLEGYNKGHCVLTKKAAVRLKKAQMQLKRVGYSLKVYDCYRPQKAINTLLRWTQNTDNLMKAEFYPHLTKHDLVKKNYIVAQSPHNQGISIDVTIVAHTPFNKITYHHGQPLIACDANNKRRNVDGSLDMGTGYACFDKASSNNYRELKLHQRENRMLLASLMKRNGFTASNDEWWHFTLNDGPKSQNHYDFDIA